MGTIIMRQIRKWLLRLIGGKQQLTPKTDSASPTRQAGDGKRRSSTVHDKQQIAEGVKKFMDEHYELRFNVMKQAEEFRPRISEKAAAFIQNPAGFEQKVAGFEQKAAGFEQKAAGFESPMPWDHSDWRQLTDRELRRIAFEQMREVGVAWPVDVELYVRSSVVPDYNPVSDFLSHCTPWDGVTDHISALARRVPTAFAQWPQYFHRWLLGMVAQWQQRSRDYGNALVPLLIGGQGTHKSTFCKLLLPPTLREYYVDDINLDSAEQVERMLGRMLLVNIDEYNAKTLREQAKIKRVLTERDVQTRKMRSDQYLMLPRMASFIATTNEREPLTDPTGSRRYLCCEVTGIIDTDAPVDYGAVYGQALAELDAGVPSYLSRDEEAALERHNQQYRQPTTAEELLTAWFEPAPRKKAYFMPATAILEELRQHVKASDMPSLKQLTITLRQCRYPHGAVNGLRGWYARKKTGS